MRVWLNALAIGAVLVTFAGTSAHGGVPQHINHQGVLTDVAGKLVEDGLYVIDFDIFTAPAPGGSLLFHQRLNVNVIGGLYNVLLSNNGESPLTLADAFASPQAYLQLTIVSGISSATGAPLPYANELLLPRQQLASVPYAFSAANLEEFTTGDVKITLKQVPDPGWILVDDGSIGSAASGATTRANSDTYALFVLIWSNCLESWAPVQDSAGVAVPRGANADADWLANRRLLVPRMLGRAIATSGAGAGLSPRDLGETLGEEMHQLTAAQMPSHDHAVPEGNSDQVQNGNGFQAKATLLGYTGGRTDSAGGDQPHNIMQPSVFLNVMMKL